MKALLQRLTRWRAAGAAAWLRSVGTDWAGALAGG